MSICRMGESGLVIRLCSVITEDGEQGFSKTGPIFLVYMESYCISVVCKLSALRPEATLFSPTSSNRSLAKVG